MSDENEKYKTLKAVADNLRSLAYFNALAAALGVFIAFQHLMVGIILLVGGLFSAGVCFALSEGFQVYRDVAINTAKSHRAIEDIRQVLLSEVRDQGGNHSKSSEASTTSNTDATPPETIPNPS